MSLLLPRLHQHRQRWRRLVKLSVMILCNTLSERAKRVLPVRAMGESSQ